MKHFKILFISLVVMILTVGCGKNPVPYQPPASCENSDSVILDRFEDPRNIAATLKLGTTVSVLETDCDECIEDVINTLETVKKLLGDTATWYELGVYLNDMFNFLEGKYGVVMIVSNQFINDMGVQYTGVINQCDKDLLLRVIEDNLAILKVAI